MENLFAWFSGQLVVASLLSRNIKSRLLLRDPEKATVLFGDQDKETLQVCPFDLQTHHQLPTNSNYTIFLSTVV